MRRLLYLSPPVYLAYEINKTEHFPTDFICYSQCHHLYPPSFNLGGHSCCSTSEFNHEFSSLTGSLSSIIPPLLYLFDTCRNNTQIINSSSTFRCPIEHKVISFHRVMDDFIDCLDAFDELFNESTCMQNSTQRYQCWTDRNECFHRRFVQDATDYCSDKSDEFYPDLCIAGKGISCDYKRGLHQLVHIQYSFQVT